MADFSNIIQEINTNLPDNTEQLITPEILRNTLIDFVNEVEDTEDGLETAIQNKQDTLTFDNTPTENSDNPVTSDGIYDALQEKADKVANATNGNFAGLDSSGNITDSGSNASDFATAAQGALADTAYQKPSTGIPASDLESGVIPQPEIFVARLNRTSYQEVADALSDGKVVIAGDSNNTYYYAGLSANNDYMFFSLLERSYSYVGVNSLDLWYMLTIPGLESTSNKVTSLSSSSNDTQYPSAKCVYDALQEKTNKVSNATNGNFAGLDSSGNITDSGSKASDFATAAQGALADTAYQKPSTGIPASDLASGVIPQPEVFFTEYGVTTNSEIENAVINGKVIVCVYNYRLYIYGTYYTVGYNTKHCFYCWVNNKCYQISLAVSTDAWTDDGYIEIPDISSKADKTSIVTLAGTSVIQELADNTIYQASELASLTITVPSGITSDYISQINFESGSTATTLTAPNTIIWYGDDIVNNVFVPVTDKQYVIMFYYDGTNVRSIVQSH